MAVGGVLALDLATVSGFAVGRLPARPVTPMEMAVTKPPQPISGVKRIGEPGCSLGVFLDQAEQWGRLLFETYRPNGIIIEMPVLPARTTPSTVRKLMGLFGVFNMLAHRNGVVWVREAQPSTVKKFICGDGSPGKENVMRAISSFGWKYKTDDESDSLALWVYAADLYAKERAA